MRKIYVAVNPGSALMSRGAILLAHDIILRKRDCFVAFVRINVLALKPKRQIEGKWSGRAITQAVTRWLSIAATRIQAPFRSYGICGGRSDTGAGFLRVFRFPLLILFPSTAPHSSSSIIQGWYIRPKSDQRTKWTSSHPTQIKNLRVMEGVGKSLPIYIRAPNYLTIYLYLNSLSLNLDWFFSFLGLCRVGRTPWTGDEPVARPLPTHRTTQTQNKYT
jgi:hypothetical protein